MGKYYLTYLNNYFSSLFIFNILLLSDWHKVSTEIIENGKRCSNHSAINSYADHMQNHRCDNEMRI